MIKYSEELACQRDLLIARCAMQREAITAQGQVLVEKLAGFDIGWSLFERLKKNPAWAVGLAVGLVVIKPPHLLRMLQTGLLAWQAFRALTPVLLNVHKNMMNCRNAKAYDPRS